MAKKLVVYFSATGKTGVVAHKLASAIGADLHEIIPQEKYKPEDLDWNNPNSRSSAEMSNKEFRPEIASTCIVRNMDEYDTIFVGFPIWWYVAPTIINSFLEQYDLKGKTIVPFATSGGSQMGETNSELAHSCVGANLKEGKKFSIKTDEAELKAWAEQF